MAGFAALLPPCTDFVLDTTKLREMFHTTVSGWQVALTAGWRNSRTRVPDAHSLHSNISDH